MAHTYRLVGWNRQKRVYDLILLAGVLVYLTAFSTTALLTHPQITTETLLIRAFGTLSFLLLNVTLSIGPLARLNPHLLPLLYNRRHLGVTTFLAALVHAGVSLVQFHAAGELSPWVSVLVSNGAYADVAFFPFQILGLAALLILFLMAATSHDLWLNLLGPAVWKSLHMAVYAAYGLLVGHIALGILQAETHPALWPVLAASLGWIGGLHLLAGWREWSRDRRSSTSPIDSSDERWIDAGPAQTLGRGRGRVVRVGDERVAVFREGNRFFALGNVCAHQGGPLGEGRVQDGCAVCPWHGYEYQLEDGTSPPPFEERVPVYALRLRQGRLQVATVPLPGGNSGPGVTIEGEREPAASDDTAPLYIGYKERAPEVHARAVKRAALFVFALSGLLAAGLAAWQEPFSSAVFEYGVESEVAGTLVVDPIPHLIVPRPGRTDSFDSYLLVRPGKNGFDDNPTLEGQVSVTGSLITDALGKMLEVHDIVERDARASTASRRTLPAVVDLGPAVHEGEVVDAKCYLGVMKPGRKKTHRACASLCVRGGIPAMLLTRAGGRPRGLTLVPASAAARSEMLDYLAEPVRVEGRLSRRADLWFLRFEAGSIHRLHPRPDSNSASGAPGREQP